ncbi:MAG: hypothetical protein HYW07_03370 [Candidatus Latescibacteria bacterium]|nr:hypothetical protein [Candidatus Latescibacterota bacterium]
MDNALLSSGLFGLIAAGLLAYIVVSWLKYQKEAASIEIKEAQLLQQSELNLRASEVAREKTTLVMEGSSELEKDVPRLRERLALLRGSQKKDKDFHSATRHKVE